MNTIAKKGIVACGVIAFAATLGFAMEKAAPKTDGAALYKKNCAACHGAKMEGNPAMAKMFKLEPASLDLKSKATAAKTDEALAKVVSDGAGKMPGYKKSLSPAEIKALVAYFHPAAPKAEAKAAPKAEAKAPAAPAPEAKPEAKPESQAPAKP